MSSGEDEAMFCPRCGTRIESDGGFCPTCGRSLKAGFLKAGPTRKRPLGLVLVVVYTAFSSLLSLGVGALAVMASGLSDTAAVPLIGVVSVLLGVLGFAACYGLWTVQKWGLSLAIFLYILSIALSVVPDLLVGALGPDAPIPSELRVFTEEPRNAGKLAISLCVLLVDIIVLVYLLGERVAKLFRGEQLNE